MRTEHTQHTTRELRPYLPTVEVRLTRRVNEELQRAFEAGVPSSEVYPSPEVYHIGTPSERTTSEGFRSVVSQRTPSVQSHPTSSPVSFGPSTPVQSASAAPAGLLSSPGGMSDVGSTLTPPGLPLRDPPRMAGSYGVPLNDPVFGISSGSIPCENPGQRPIPAPTPPPPAGSAGMKDPYVHLLESQSAMSMLMMQMAREMNQRSLQQPLPQQQQQQVGQDPNQPQAAGQQGGQTGAYQKEMKMDEKWIPAMPVPGWKSWTSRGKELSGFKDWLEKFSGWLSLIHDAYGPELWETIHADYPIRPCRSPEQLMRSKRLFHILQQQFMGYSKIENLIRSRISATGITESNGFELLRLIRKEFSLMSRTEALSYREMCLKFRVKRTEHLLDIIREVESEIESFHAMLDASVIVHQLGDVRISEGDQFLLYLRNLPSKVQEFLQLHQNAVTVQQLKTGVQDYYIRTRVQGDLRSVHVAQPVAKADLKDKTCLSTSKEVKALSWQVSELRSGSTDAQGTVPANKGSLLYLISEDLKTSSQSMLDALAKSVKSLNETVEAGVKPEKSLKRKFHEYQEQQRAEEQRKEEERRQKELEDQERQQLVMMIHPYTGQQMYLTGEQRYQFIRDLSTMKPTDFMSNVPVGTGSMGAGTPPIPSRGFPPGPPTGMGYGAMGTPATPSTPNPPGYVPSFTAPTTLPVISKPTAS